LALEDHSRNPKLDRVAESAQAVMADVVQQGQSDTEDENGACVGDGTADALQYQLDHIANEEPDKEEGECEELVYMVMFDV
jgi:hypothetical protein